MLLALLGLGVGAGQVIGGVVTEVARTGGLPAPLASDLPVWTGSERVTILVMGLDHREDEPLENARADTMLLLSLDPQRKTAGLLSLPRDLLVNIPLDDKRRVEDRLNTVFVYAYLHDLPGGGPALARRTVQQLLGGTGPVHRLGGLCGVRARGRPARWTNPRRPYATQG